nr:dihydrofolate reductase family protein [Corynebacterium lactis]
MSEQPHLDEILRFLGRCAPPSPDPAPPAAVTSAPSPCTTAIAVTSIDGRGAIDGTSGALGNATDALLFNTLRALSDAVFVGPGTIIAENYGPVEVPEELAPLRAQRGQRPYVAMATLSRSLDLDTSLPFFPGADASPRADAPIIFTRSETELPRQERERFHRRRQACEAAGARVIELPAPTVAEAMRALRTMGFSAINVEGGPTIYRQALLEDCVDEVFLTVAPTWVGAGPATFGTPDGEGTPPTPRTFTLAGTLVRDSHLFLRYFRSRSH